MGPGAELALHSRNLCSLACAVGIVGMPRIPIELSQNCEQGGQQSSLGDPAPPSSLPVVRTLSPGAKAQRKGSRGLLQSPGDPEGPRPSPAPVLLAPPLPPPDWPRGGRWQRRALIGGKFAAALLHGGESESASGGGGRGSEGVGLRRGDSLDRWPARSRTRHTTRCGGPAWAPAAHSC